MSADPISRLEAVQREIDRVFALLLCVVRQGLCQRTSPKDRSRRASILS